MIDKHDLAMVGGGSLSVVTANTDKIEQSVNLLNYVLWDNGIVYVTPGVLITVVGISIAVAGCYRSLTRNKKDE